MDETKKKSIIFTIDGKPVGEVRKLFTMSGTFKSDNSDSQDFLKRMKATEGERQQLQNRFDEEFSADQKQGIREGMVMLANVLLWIGASAFTQYAPTVDGGKIMIKLEVIKEGEFGWMEEPKA